MPRPRLIVLAYSGGLDTSIIVPWLKENYDGARVICVAADIGQGDGELEGVRAKAIASGAEECYVEDLREEFVRDFIFPMLRAGAVYNRKYLLGTSAARPLIARRQVEIARAVGADALAHGCTGKGNDQVRFELTYAAFAPELPVIAPWREWDIRSREDAIAYAAARGIPVAATKEKIYSRDANLWHLSHEGGILEDPNAAPPADLLQRTKRPMDAPDAPETVTIGFEGGTPVSVNGAPLGPVELVEALDAIGGEHGVGVVRGVDDHRLAVVTDQPHVVVDLEVLPVEAEDAGDDEPVDPRAHASSSLALVGPASGAAVLTGELASSLTCPTPPPSAAPRPGAGCRRPPRRRPGRWPR